MKGTIENVGKFLYFSTGTGFVCLGQVILHSPYWPKYIVFSYNWRRLSFIVWELCSWTIHLVYYTYCFVPWWNFKLLMPLLFEKQLRTRLVSYLKIERGQSHYLFTSLRTKMLTIPTFHGDNKMVFVLERYCSGWWLLFLLLIS